MTLKDICIDCADPYALAHWWAPVLGMVVRPWSDEDVASLRARGLSGPEEDPFVALDPPTGKGTGLSVWFLRVPEPKTVKNRVHLDVHGDVGAIAASGGTVLAALEHWTVMADPEGNEFCVFTPTP
jgi:Glyoxalase-like domain